MANDTMIDTLNDLIATSKDGEQGFLVASKHAHSVTLRALFADFSADCRRAAAELQDCVAALGGTATTSGTTAGALHRGWMNLRTSVTSADDLALLQECERGEDHAKACYAAAMNTKIAPAVRTLLERQSQGALRHHDRIRDLRNREKASA